MEVVVEIAIVVVLVILYMYFVAITLVRLTYPASNGGREDFSTAVTPEILK